MRLPATRPVPTLPVLRAVGLALVVAGLAACEVRTGSASGTTAPTAPAGAPTAAGPAASAGAGGAGYVALDGCYRFTPAAGWTRTKEAKGAATFTIVAETTTDAALEVDTACSPLDKVGPDGPIDLPDGKVAVDERVAFGGAKGRHITYRLTVKGSPVYVLDNRSVDRNGVRCTFEIAGPEMLVQAHRAELDAAVATYACDGP